MPVGVGVGGGVPPKKESWGRATTDKKPSSKLPEEPWSQVSCGKAQRKWRHGVMEEQGVS